jgi:hypothetical protein
MLVRIIPINKRAKNHVKEHGEIMELLGFTDLAFSVTSLNNTWQNQKWTGWFLLDSEARFEEVK